VIVGIDGTNIASYDDLYSALENYKIGDATDLAVDRDGKVRRVRFTLVKD